MIWKKLHQCRFKSGENPAPRHMFLISRVICHDSRGLNALNESNSSHGKRYYSRRWKFEPKTARKSLTLETYCSGEKFLAKIPRTRETKNWWREIEEIEKKLLVARKPCVWSCLRKNYHGGIETLYTCMKNWTTDGPLAKGFLCLIQPFITRLTPHFLLFLRGRNSNVLTIALCTPQK